MEGRKEGGTDGRTEGGDGRSGEGGTEAGAAEPRRRCAQGCPGAPGTRGSRRPVVGGSGRPAGGGSRRPPSLCPVRRTSVRWPCWIRRGSWPGLRHRRLGLRPPRRSRRSRRLSKSRRPLKTRPARGARHFIGPRLHRREHGGHGRSAEMPVTVRLSRRRDRVRARTQGRRRWRRARPTRRDRGAPSGTIPHSTPPPPAAPPAAAAPSATDPARHTSDGDRAAAAEEPPPRRRTGVDVLPAAVAAPPARPVHPWDWLGLCRWCAAKVCGVRF